MVSELTRSEHSANKISSDSMVWAEDLKKTGRLNMPCFNQYTPLGSSVKASDFNSIYGERVLALLAVGASLEARGKHDYTPLMVFAYKGENLKFAEILLDAGANLEAKNDFDQTAFMIAVQNGVEEKAKFFLDRGADAKVKDKSGRTVLMIAVAYCSVDFMKELVTRGVDLNAKDKDGKTALMYAAERNRLDKVEYLLSIEGIDRDGFDVYIAEQYAEKQNELESRKQELQVAFKRSGVYSLAKIAGLTEKVGGQPQQVGWEFPAQTQG